MIRLLTSIAIIGLAAITTFAVASDSIASTTYCKVVPQEEGMFRLIYQSAKDEIAYIRVTDLELNVLHEEQVSSDLGFTKSYNLSFLPPGQYQFELKSPGYIYQETLTIGEAKPYQFVFKQLDDNSIALIGSDDSENGMSLYILDDKQEAIYEERFRETNSVRRKFIFQNINTDDVTFLIYREGELVQKATFGF